VPVGEVGVEAAVDYDEGDYAEVDGSE